MSHIREIKLVGLAAMMATADGDEKYCFENERFQ